MEDEIRHFWQQNPCGARLVGDLTADERRDYLDFFSRYDDFRYNKEPHILENIRRLDLEGKRLLEIGLGQGADAEKLALCGAVYNGIDLTDESVKRVRMRFDLKGLPYGTIERSSVLSLPFADNGFDIVFSHGVLHHVPEIRKASSEISRVLKPGGELVVMLYARRSLNYLVSISIMRRLGLLALHTVGAKPTGIIGEHLQNARDVGIFRYLAMDSFIHRNTDGPDNPYSKVYGLSEVRSDFPDFDITKTYRSFMHAPPLPVGRLPFAGALGWHLWVHMRPKK